MKYSDNTIIQFLKDKAVMAYEALVEKYLPWYDDIKYEAESQDCTGESYLG